MCLLLELQISSFPSSNSGQISISDLKWGRKEYRASVSIDCFSLRQHIKKQRHHFVNKGLSSQGCGFSSGLVWMWELDYKESWAQKNWCFWTVVLEKTLESPLGCNQSILKEISPGCSLEGLVLKLKLQYFGHLMWRADSVEKTLMLGKIEGRRRRRRQRMRWWDGITDSVDMGFGWLWDFVMDREAWHAWFMGSQRVRHYWATEQNWITPLIFIFITYYYLAKKRPYF